MADKDESTSDAVTIDTNPENLFAKVEGDIILNFH
jgi:hypothetical protein